jgi:hypothetical protein
MPGGARINKGSKKQGAGSVEKTGVQVRVTTLFIVAPKR